MRASRQSVDRRNAPPRKHADSRGGLYSNRELPRRYLPNRDPSKPVMRQGRPGFGSMEPSYEPRASARAIQEKIPRRSERGVPTQHGIPRCVHRKAREKDHGRAHPRDTHCERRWVVERKSAAAPTSPSPSASGHPAKCSKAGLPNEEGMRSFRFLLPADSPEPYECRSPRYALTLRLQFEPAIQTAQTPWTNLCRPREDHRLYLARIPHRLPRETADTLADTASRSVGRLDALSSPPAAASVAPLVCAASGPVREA